MTYFEVIRTVFQGFYLLLREGTSQDYIKFFLCLALSCLVFFILDRVFNAICIMRYLSSAPSEEAKEVSDT